MNSLSGTAALLRLYLRRDRLVLPIWVVLLGALPLLYAVSFEGLYPTAADRRAFYLSTEAVPAQAALVGPIFGSDLGALVSWRAGLMLTLVPLAAILTVVRHTRGEEDAGRVELVGSTAVGRFAGLTAAVLLAGGGVVATGMLSFVSLWAFGLPVAGSVAFGASIVVVGAVFVGCAGLAAQVASGVRAARGYALGVLAAAFVLRAIGDIGSGTLSWFSPIGWSAQVRPFADERWWPLLLSLALRGLLRPRLQGRCCVLGAFCCRKRPWKEWWRVGSGRGAGAWWLGLGRVMFRKQKAAWRPRRLWKSGLALQEPMALTHYAHSRCHGRHMCAGVRPSSRRCPRGPHGPGVRRPSSGP